MESALITIFADLLSVGSSRINIATSRRRLLAASVTVRVVASSPAEATTLAAVLSDMDLAAHIALHLSWQTITVSNIQIAVEDLATTTTPQPTLAPETSAPTTAPPSTPPPPSAIPVVAAVPSKCEIGGGTVVTLILGASPPAFAAPPAVVFSSDAQEVTSSVVSPSTLVAKCPAASQSAGLGEIVVAGGGSVLARFEFVYVLPAPSVSPAQVLASGGSVDISIFGSPPPAIPADCNVTFGGVAGSIVSSSAAGSQLVVKTIAPPALTAGRVALALTCVDVSGLRLTYLAVPEATAVVTVPSAGECLTWGECTVAVAMTDAPSTATEASELLLACSGVDFDVFPGSTSRDPRLAVLQATPDLLSATVAFPPPQTAGTITCQLAPLTAPAGINPADMAASFSIQVSLPPAAINSVRPSSVPLNAGAEVEIVVSGVGVLADTSSLVIVIGGLPVSGWSLLYSDVEVSAIMLAAPTALGIGNADIQITVTGTGATSSSSLVVVPTDQNAECVSGCRVGASGSADGSWAAVALGGFPADASANNINAEVDGTLGEVVGFDAERNLWLVDLPAVAFGGAENGGADVSRWLRLQTPAGGGAEALVEVWYVPAPRVEYARFAANGAGIEVRFDTDTNMEGTGACAAVAGVPGDAMGLGSQPVCSWTEPSVLWIALGSGATVLPGTLLAVTAPGVTSADGASDAMPVSEVQVERPRSFLVPELSMVGPAQVAGCDAVAMFTSGASARPMRFEWGCDSNFAVARALASLNASEASFPGDLLVLNEPTEVWVQATTFLGAKSRVLSTVVTRVAVPPPLVSIEVPPPPYLPSSALFFSASCKFSQCAQTETQLRFSWILSPGLEVDPDNIVLAGDKVSFGIPADTLEAGQHYTLTLQTSQGSQLPVTSTVSLNILSSPLVAKMAGGNRLVSRTATVVLDASMSHDPDDAACVSGQVQSEECLSALAFSWRCVTVSAAGQQACRLKGLEKLQLSATAVASLDMSSLALTNADSILVTVTVQGSRGRFATASASFSLAVGDVVDVGITEGAQSAGRVVYSASVHSDIGASASAGNVSYGWRLVGPGLDGAGYTGLALSPWDSNQLILNVGSNLAMQLFQAGAKYMVQLVVRSGGVEGMSKVQLRRPMPPFGGSCWMEVAEAEELVGALVARCENWNAESLPLSYRYGASVAPWAAATAKWSVPTYLSRAELRLSEGDYALAVEVLDDVGTSTVTQSMGAVVTAASSTTEGEREETLAGVLTELDQLGSVSQLMQLSQSIMQGVSSEQSGSGGRRLLASSAAYRLRVRRMLLNQMEGGVAESMSTRTAPAALLTTQQLTAADSPNELQPGMGSSAVVLFERASEELGAGEVSEQLLLDAMQVCNAILFASQMEQTESARDQVIRAALTSMQAVGGQFANKMYVAQQAHDVVLSNVALEVMKVPTANQTLANLDLNTDAGALISMSLKSPIEVGLEKDDGIAVLQIKLTHDVWNHQRIQVISHGVSGVIFMDQSEDEGDARDRRCHDGDCMQLTVDVDLSGRSIAELELFELGLGVTCYRWDHAYWDGQSCKATTLLPAGSNWTQVQLESRVQCNCDQPDGLFVVGFSTSFYLPMEAPWLTTKYYRIVHSGYFRDSFLMGFFGTLTFTVLAVLIPFLYLNRWFPYFGHEEGRSNLYVHANLVEAEQHIFHTVRAKKFPLLCSFKATTPSRLVDPDQIEEDDQPTRPSTAQTATGVEVEMGSTRQDSKGNLFTQRFASAGREMLRSATLTSSGKSSGNGHAEQHSARWDVMQAWGSSKVSSKQHARAQGQKTARQEGLLRAITDRSIGSARIDTTLDIYGAGHRKLVNEDGIFYWETLGVNHAQVLEPFAWSYAHWFAECPVDPALQPVCPSPDMQALDANDTTNAVETLAFAEGSPRARRRSSGTTAYLLAETRGLWSSKARLPPLSVDRLGSYRSLAPPGLLPPASAPDLPDLPAGLPDELEVPPRRPSPPPSPPSNPYMLELEAVRKEREREARERERGAGVLPGLMKSQESMMKMPVEDGGFLGPAGWENSPPRHPAPDPAPPTCTPSAAEPDPAVLLFQAARVRSSESPEAPAVSASLVNATALASPKAHTLLQSAESAEAAGEPPSLPESRPESSMASPTGGNGSQLASAVSVRVDSSTSIDRLESLVDRGRPAYVGDLQRIDSSMSITRLENLAGVGRQDSVRLGSGEWMQKRNSVDCMVSPRDAGSPRPLDSIKNLEQFESLPFERAPSGGRLGGGEWMQRNMSVENLAAVGLTPPRAEVESDLYLEGGQLGRPKRLAGASPRRAGRRGSDFEIALAPRVEEQEEHASSGDEHKTPRMQGVAAEGGRKPETAEGEARNPVGASTPPLGASPVAGARKAPSPRSAPSLEGLEPTVLGLEMGLPGLGPRPLVEDGIGSGDAPTPRIGTADVDDADV